MQRLNVFLQEWIVNGDDLEGEGYVDLIDQFGMKLIAVFGDGTEKCRMQSGEVLKHLLGVIVWMQFPSLIVDDS